MDYFKAVLFIKPSSDARQLRAALDKIALDVTPARLRQLRAEGARIARLLSYSEAVGGGSAPDHETAAGAEAGGGGRRGAKRPDVAAPEQVRNKRAQTAIHARPRLESVVLSCVCNKRFTIRFV